MSQDVLTTAAAAIAQVNVLLRPVLVAIDGPCAAGKTGFARALAQQIGAAVVHADDFFLPPALRTPARLAVPGGNLHYERLLAQVLLPLRQTGRACFQPYDCHADALRPAIVLECPRVVLVEGSYTCQPALWDQYDLHFFLTLDAAEQRKRITARNGMEAHRFFEEWIPLENAYFAACDPAARCEWQSAWPG